jgi:Lysophospholipase
MLDDLAQEGFQLVMYDQLGCGQSSAPDQPELWQAQTWLDELTELRSYLHLDHVHLLGQSFGGMLALMYLLEKNRKECKA